MIKDNWTLNNYQMQAREFAIYPERHADHVPRSRSWLVRLVR